MKNVRSRTRLDAETLVMAEAPLGGPELAGGLALAGRTMAADDAAGGASRATLKLQIAPGTEKAAVEWVVGRQGAVRSSGPGVLIAELPASAVKALESAEWLRRAEAPRKLLPSLDQARAACGLDTAQTTHSLTGAGVLLGIIDSGVDWAHPDFRNPDGTTRIETFIHASGNNPLDSFNNAQINSALTGGPPIPVGDPNGHGTHCASIAAGNGRGFGATGLFRGVATGAALMAMRSDELFDTHIIEGIRRIFAHADSTDRPAVISLSLGGHIGAHDGTSAIENAISLHSGPGRIVVVAAGNEGEDNIHWQGDLHDGPLDIVFTIRDSDIQFVDVWIPRGDEVDVLIVRPDGVSEEPDGEEHQGSFGAYLAMPSIDAINRDQNLRVLVGGDAIGSQWTIRLIPISVTQGVVHAWGGTNKVSTSINIFPAAAPGFTLGMPSTEERAVSVASFVSRVTFAGPGGNLTIPGLVNGSLSGFSSRGPTRNGSLKPDIAAPGQVVTAALSSGSELATLPNLAQRRHPSGAYVTIQGTSMATPFVAGVVALMLEKNRKLTPEEVHQRLRATARRDAGTGPVWNAGFGWGKIDVEALLEYGAQLDGPS